MSIAQQIVNRMKGYGFKLFLTIKLYFNFLIVFPLNKLINICEK